MHEESGSEPTACSLCGYAHHTVFIENAASLGDSCLSGREFPWLLLSRLHGILLLPALQVQVLICTGDSGSNPERALYRQICYL
jgi:hypothetical protein